MSLFTVPPTNRTTRQTIVAWIATLLAAPLAALHAADTPAAKSSIDRQALVTRHNITEERLFHRGDQWRLVSARQWRPALRRGDDGCRLGWRARQAGSRFPRMTVHGL
jgi:hypothetical protein